MAINKVTQASRQAIRDKTVRDIPDRPSERGYSADELKALFSKAIFDEENSALAELDRVVEEINDYIGDLNESDSVKQYIQNYVIGQLVSVAPITSISFSNGLISYTKYHNNSSLSGSVDITPENAVFWNGNSLTDKSGNVKYPTTLLDRVNDNVNDKSLRTIINEIISSISTLDDKHDSDYSNIQNQLATIIGGNAPEALDTIRELAQALKNDPDTIDDILQSISNLDSGKVDKVSGKGLSTNDFTNALKSALESLNSRNLVDEEDLKTDLSEFNDDATHRLVTDEEKASWNSKANGTHSHQINDVTGLPDALNNKSDINHTHNYSDVGAEQAGVAASLISAHNQSTTSHSDIRAEIQLLRSKVDGRINAISFDNLAHLQQWIAGTYTRQDGLSPSDLTLGTNIYIDDQDVDDYWVSSVPVSSMTNLSVLPTDKVDLTDYVRYIELGAVATSNNYNDLDNLPDLSGISTNASNIAQNTQDIANNATNIALKQNHNLGSSEANKMLITDENGNIVTTQMGSVFSLVNDFNDANTIISAPTARLAYLLNNSKLDKQQGVENANKYLYVGNDGLIHLQNIKTKLSEFTNDENFASETYVDNSIASIPTPDVSGQISTHNESATAHEDIRQLIQSIQSNLSNDYATKSYVDTNGGKINSLSAGGTPLTIDADKNVNIPIAGNSVKGVVDVRAFFGNSVDQYGRLNIVTATNQEIEAKTNIYHPITSSNIDNVVKVGITTNTNTLTAEEKSNAQRWLGIDTDYAKKSEIPTNTNELTNGAGFITGIDSQDVTTALGYTPYNATNPNGYQTASQVNDTISSATTGMLTTSNYENTLDDVYQAKGNYASASDLNTLAGRVTTAEGDIDDLEALIPAQATSSNQLADKAFVNSSISTATATFRGTFDTLSELQATSGDLNDYAYLEVYDSTEPTQVKQYDRYKHNGSGWAFEYTLNNSSFTASQWAAINSGITSNLVGKITTNENNINNLSSNKQDVINDLSTIRNGASAGSTAVQPSDLSSVATSGDYDDLTNKPITEITSSTFKIYGNNPGIYKFAYSGETDLYYSGNSESSAIIVKQGDILLITDVINGYTNWTLFTMSEIYSGSTNSSSGYATQRKTTLNGTGVLNPSFYAPTTAGTSGQFLKSNGSGAPTWQTVTIPDTSSLVPNTRKVNNKALTNDITLGYSDVSALPSYSLSIGSTNGGNPRQVRFCSVNYTNFDSGNGAYFKLGAMSGHGNGSSYTFVEDIFINVNYQGAVTCNVYKYVQQAVTLDNVARNYGDIFWTIDTTNKIVYFYILLGQYSSAQFTPGTKIGAAKAVTSANGIIQYTGTPTYYSSGTKVWATGNSTTYARLSDVPTVQVYNSEEEAQAASQADPNKICLF